MKRVLTVWTGIIVLSGCTSMAPKYEQPVMPVPAAWPAGASYKTETAALPGKGMADIPWRGFFTDERLRKVIELSLQNNRDLRMTALAIERTRAQYQIRRSDLFPKVDAVAGASFQGVPGELASAGRAATTEQYSVGLGVTSYELDFFGRVQSLRDQALEQYLATEQAYRSARISLVSQVAAAYLALAADRERLRTARETLETQLQSFELVRSRFQAGIATALDLNQSRTAVEGARLDIARFTTLTAQDENALVLLTGTPVDPVLLPEALAENITPAGDLAAGLPSDVLLRRPDIVQAENLLKGFNASIGAARANFFPKISLVSSLGFGSNDLAGLFTGNSFMWSFAPRVSLPLFDGGANKAGLTVAEADRDAAVAQYEKAVQTAFREVADALAQRGTISEQLAAQQALTDATAETYQMSQARYRQGIDSYLQVLDAQRSLYSARQNLIGVRLARLISQVTLYKVLGGGTAPTDTP